MVNVNPNEVLSFFQKLDKNGDNKVDKSDYQVKDVAQDVKKRNEQIRNALGITEDNGVSYTYEQVETNYETLRAHVAPLLQEIKGKEKANMGLQKEPASSQAPEFTYLLNLNMQISNILNADPNDYSLGGGAELLNSASDILQELTEVLDKYPDFEGRDNLIKSKNALENKLKN